MLFGRLLGVLCMVSASCGRIGFAPGNDAAVQLDSPSLLACTTSSTAPAVVTISGRTFRYTSFDNTWATVPNVVVTALSRADSQVLGTTTSDASGAYAVPITTGGVAPGIVLSADTGGAYLTTLEALDLLVDRDVTPPTMTTNDVLDPGDVPVWDTGAMTSIYGQVGLARDTARGTLNIAVRDCSGSPVPGVTIELDPPAPLLLYQAPDGSASQTLTSTEPPFCHALAFNSPAGPTRIVARKDGQVVASETVDVGGAANTQTLIHVPN